jgi:hypothetical protein
VRKRGEGIWVGEIRCRRTSYEVAPGAWESPRPPVCDLIETAAASVGLSGLTPGCELWFICDLGNKYRDLEWAMYMNIHEHT